MSQADPQAAGEMQEIAEQVSTEENSQKVSELVLATCFEDVAIRQQSRTIVNPSVLQAAGGRPSPTPVMNQSGLLSCS